MCVCVFVCVYKSKCRETFTQLLRAGTLDDRMIDVEVPADR